MVELHATKRFFKSKQPYLMIISVSRLPVIAQLVERRTVVGQSPDILRSAVRLRLAGKHFSIIQNINEQGGICLILT